MTARCKVCHRTMTNPAHIAMGMGPVCAANAAKRASVTDGAPARRAYPVERYEMVRSGAEKLAARLTLASLNVVRTHAQGTREEQAEAERVYRLTQHWYERVKRMEQRAYRLAVG